MRKQNTPIITYLRKSKTFKVLMAYSALNFLALQIAPNLSWALTSGPAQEEFASFEPASTSDMVNLYTGDFTYNLPLLSVPGPNGGYPINLAYHSGVGMEQEASWVGLGWTLNTGAVNRQLRGLPDDFSGDVVERQMHYKRGRNVALDVPYDLVNGAPYTENFGMPQNPMDANISYGAQVYYNNFKGLGLRTSVNIISNLGQQGSPLQGRLGLTRDTQEGNDVSAGISLAQQQSKAKIPLGVEASVNLNSRQGLTNIGFASMLRLKRGTQRVSTTDWINVATTHAYYGKYATSSSSSLNFGVNQNTPAISMPTSTRTIPASIKLGGNLSHDYAITNVSPAIFPVGGISIVTEQAKKFGWFDSEFPQLWSGSVSYVKGPENGVVQNNAYGYLNTQNVGGNEAKKAMFDLNHTPDVYNKNLPALAVPSYTYDAYLHTGQGTGGAFRPFRSSVDVLSNAQTESDSRSISTNFEFGSDDLHVPAAHQGYHIGAGVIVTVGKNMTGDWSSGTDGLDQLEFLGIPDEHYEPYYMAVYGEQTAEPESQTLWSAWEQDKALRNVLDLDNPGDWYNHDFKATNQFIENATDATSPPMTQNLKNRSERKARTKVIQNLTGEEASKYGLSKELTYLDFQGNIVAKTFPQNSDHLTSEIDVTQPDGMRYNYGLPVMNHTQVDAQFSVEEPNGDHNTTAVDVDEAYVFSLLDDNGNTSTNPQFLNKTTLPTYASAWLLTSVMADDYVDLTNDGPSDDDYGYWVKMQYQKTANDYHWRVPYQGARFVEGNISDETDDKGFYSYGNKDLFYLKTVETKTHIAVFYLSAREDGAEAGGANPEYFQSTEQPGAIHTKKLDSIALYTKADWLANGQNAVPFQTVHMEYSYELCPEVPNNPGNPVDKYGNAVAANSPDNVNALKGKLTLKKVWFTYQHSSRGELSPYVFDYGDLGTPGAPTADNPMYEQRNIDRWGNYANNEELYALNEYPFIEFPYTQQGNNTKAPNHPDLFPNAAPFEAPTAEWNLKQMDLPSGGTMNIEYESDDYAYVQDQKAMQMFDIVSLGHRDDLGVDEFTPQNLPQTFVPQGNFPLRDGAGDIGFTQESYELNGKKLYRIFVRLEEECSDAEFESKYLDGIEHVYFKTLANLDNPVTGDPHVDFVEGWAKVSHETGTFGTCSYQARNDIIGFFSVEAAELNELFGEIHPFRKAALQHLRFNRSELLFDVNIPDGSVSAQIVNLLTQTISSFNDLAGSFVGFYAWAHTKGMGKNIHLNGKSIVRLNNPNGFKYGGGCRVKQLTISDNWSNSATSLDDAKYGQKYDYTIEEEGQVISSGVAYEPTIGVEESALRNPIVYSPSKFIGAKQQVYMDKPLMEEYYPGQQVGYRKVTVSSIGPDQAKLADLVDDQLDNNSISIVSDALPYSVYEFYTPKEFPVIEHKTDMNADPTIIRAIPIPGIYAGLKVHKARSQGYSVVLNDMAGRARSVSQYTLPPTPGTDPTASLNQNGTLLSRQEYIYNTVNEFNPSTSNELNSEVKVILDDSNFGTAIMGQNFDVFVSRNENSEEMHSRGFDVNFELAVPNSGSTVPPWALIPLPYFMDYRADFKSVVTTKVIHRSAILKKTISTTDQSTVTSEVLAFDQKTGSPILTRVTNEHEDPIFSYNYPAHWYYPAVSTAYDNVGVDFTTSQGGHQLNMASSGILSGFTASTTLSEYFIEGTELFIEYAAGPTLRTHVVSVDDVNGNLSVVELDGTYPTDLGAITDITVIRPGNKNMLFASAGALSAKVLNGFDPSQASGTYSFDDKSILSAGAVEFGDYWHAICGQDNCAVQSGLDVVNPYKTGIKGNWRPVRSYAYLTDRIYNQNTRTDGTYTDFERYTWEDPAIANPKWTEASTTTKFSPFGFGLEERDPLGIYSAAVYGYNNALPVAVGGNMKYSEIAFDGFEDYPKQCVNDHFSFAQAPVQTTAHTGLYSIEIPAGGQVLNTWGMNPPDCDDRDYDAGIKSDVRGYYELQDCDCIGEFSPTEQKKFVFSAWVREGTSDPVTAISYDNIRVRVNFLNSSGQALPTFFEFQPDGHIIEGWQRVYAEFELPAGAVDMELVVFNANTSNAAYIDDVRFHPFDGNMVSYVYNPLSLKVEAELDGNNYATFYIYDEEGALVKTKKETYRGIQTIQEGQATPQRAKYTQ